jgi:hypothetical protein
MPTIPQRIASAFAVLCGRYGDVTEMAKGRERSRQSLYREAEQVASAVDGAMAKAQIEELQRQLAERQAEVKALEKRLTVLSGRTYVSCRQAEQPVGGGLNLFLGDPGT